MVDECAKSVSAAAPVELDLRGLKCPLPAIKTAKALNSMTNGMLLVRTTDPMSAIDIPHAATSVGARVLSRSSEGRELHFLIEK